MARKSNPKQFRIKAAEIARREGQLIPRYLDGEESIARDRKDLVAMSRDMFLNNGIYRSIINSLVGIIVGPDGAEFSPNLENEDIKNLLQSRFSEWTKYADYSRRFTFSEMERIICTEILVAGEVLLIKRRKDLSLQIIESERITEVVADPSSGRITGFKIADQSKKLGYETVKAEDAIYISAADRYSQIRGVGLLWSVIDVCNMLMYALRTACKSMALAAKYAVSVEKAEANQLASQLAKASATEDGEEIDDDTDLEGRSYEVEGAQMFFGKPGEKVNIINQAGAPNPNLNNHVLTFLRIICSVIGVDPATFILSDYSQVNFSSSKAANIALRRITKKYQSMFDYRFYSRVGRYLVGTWLLIDEDLKSENQAEIINSVAWIYPSPPIQNNKDEAEGNRLELDLGLVSHDQLLLERNVDPTEYESRRYAEISRAVQLTEKIKAELGVEVPYEYFAGLPMPKQGGLV